MKNRTTVWVGASFLLVAASSPLWASVSRDERLVGDEARSHKELLTRTMDASKSRLQFHPQAAIRLDSVLRDLLEGRVQRALEEADLAVRADDRYAPSYVIRGLIQSVLDAPDRAISDFSLAIEL